MKIQSTVVFQDLKGTVAKVADFIGVKCNDDELNKTVENLGFSKQKEKDDTEIAIKLGLFKENEGSFIRSGKHM